jgi:hypothetical protein
LSSKQTPYIVGAAVLLLFLLLYYFSGNGKANYSWVEHYKPGSKDPYGTYLVRNLLEDYYPNDSFQVVKDSLGARLDSGNFVYVGNDFWLDSASINELLDFVAAGNRAFIASPYMPHGLLDSIAGFECVYEYNEHLNSTLSDTMVSLNFQHPSLFDTAGYPLKFLFLRQPKQYTWNYLPSEYLCDSQTVFARLGLLNDEQVNFVRASYGDGEFYLHTTPLAFTNLHLVEKRGVEYASKAFSHLKPGPIYWDERTFDPFKDMAGGGSGPQKSPLKYILSQPPLAWAWYVMLGMALLYLIFRAKRRQRVIPVLEKNTNTSLEFIGTMGRLFFTQNNHRQLAAQKMRLFLIFVRERYHLPTKELNEQFVKGLAIRSNLTEEHINKILNLNRNISNSGFLSEDTLVDFHRLMEKFYRECK